MLAALPVLAAVLAGMPAPPAFAWPTVAGLGGAIGRLLASTGLSVGRDVLGPVGALMIWTIGLALAVTLTLLALGLSAGEWRAAGRGRRARIPCAAGARRCRCRVLGCLPPAALAALPPRHAGAVVRREPAGGDAAGRRAMDEPPPPSWRAPRGPPPPPRRPRQESLPLPEAGWRFPPLSLLKPAPARAASRAQRGGAAGERPAAGDGAGRLRRAGQHRGDPPRAGGDAVRTGAGAGHPQRAGDRPGGRRGAQPVGDRGAHRHRARPQRDRHRGAERQARDRVPVARSCPPTKLQKHAGRLTLALGKDISGAPIFADLARMPHLMIAGTTGSGKSVGVNAMILSLLYRLSPDQCRLILIDPKMLELSIYEGIPHLMAPVVTEPAKAVTALKWTVREMERRYRAMSQLGVRNIGGYNDRVAEARAKGEVVTRRVQTGFDPDTGRPTFEEQPLALEPLPLIVVVVDEMADLMMVAGKEIEAAVQRLAQMARAAGIHVIMATQRPSVDVITGTIKANFPTRISFQVISKFDSRTILGEQGAEQLLGMGDMLFMQGGGRITRVHGPFVSDEEVEKVVEFLREQGEPAYLEEVTEPADDDGAAMLPGLGAAGDGEKGLYDQAVAVVAREGKASTSFIQRHLNIGYNRAAKLIEQMEKEGVVGPANHVGKREVLVPAGDGGGGLGRAPGGSGLLRFVSMKRIAGWCRADGTVPARKCLDAVSLHDYRDLSR